MAGQKPRYTTILHEGRISLGLSVNEYCVADSIHKLSHSSRYSWCEMKRQEMASFHGLTGRTIINICNRLLKKEIIEKDPRTKFLRTTEKWIKAVEVDSGEKLSPTMKNFHLGGEKLSPPHNEKFSPSDNDNGDNDRITSVGVKNHKIIGIIKLFASLKGTPPAAMGSFLKRNLRPAGILVDYSDDKLEKVMVWLRDNADFPWGLETVAKLVDEDFSKLKSWGEKMRQGRGDDVPFYFKKFIPPK